MRTEITIAGRTIGQGHPAMIVAELSANHLGDYSIAERTIRAMARAGADAVKLQTYKPSGITLDAGTAHFKIQHGTLWDGRTLHDLYSEGMMPWDWQPKLKQLANELGLIFFSSPFDHEAVDFLDSIGVAAFKIASLEITDIPLIEHAASKARPVIISTGIATLEEIGVAIDACRRMGNDSVILLKCTSAYPTPPEEMNLRLMPEMRERFRVPVGLSDHMPGHEAAIAAVALGACMIEKHFILDRKAGGLDAAFSMEPDEFSRMARSVRIAEAALGSPTYELTPGALSGRGFRRSLFVAEDIKKGEPLTDSNVRSVRPGAGLPPAMLRSILGRRARADIKKGTPLSMDIIE